MYELALFVLLVVKTRQEGLLLPLLYVQDKARLFARIKPPAEVLAHGVSVCQKRSFNVPINILNNIICSGRVR